MKKKPKDKKCVICLSYFQPYSSTATACSLRCAISIATQKRLAKADRDARKQEKVERKAHRARKKKFYDNDLTKQLKLTQTVFNKLRKLEEFKWYQDRGLEPECISCGKKDMDWCCSHLKTVGSHSELRFDRDNTKLACNRYCNKALSGNINGNKTTRGYLVGLVDRFGRFEAKRIMDYCNTSKVRKWKCDELIEMRKDFSKRIKELS